MNLQVLIPIYNEQEAFYECFLKIDEVLRDDGFEPKFFIIDDGSKDDTWGLLKKISKEKPYVRAFRLSRNFGKEVALFAGVDMLEDELTVVMDGDLQHPPKYVKKMYDEMHSKNCDIVEGIKASRGKESLSYKIFAKSFYKLLKLASGLSMDNSSDFKLISGRVIKSLKDFDERHIFFRGLVNYVGFDKRKIEFEVEDRKGGKSSFNFRKLSILAIDAVISYTGKLLYLVFGSSIIFLLFSIIMVINTLYNYFSNKSVSGFSTVIILILLSSSLVMMSLGIIGVYLSRVYEEVKGRPIYIIKETTDD